MASFWFWAFLAYYAIALVAIARILIRPKEPTAMVAWIFALLCVPGLGLLAYWLFGSRRLRRKVRRRRRRVASLLAEFKRRAEERSHPSTETHDAELDRKSVV